MLRERIILSRYSTQPGHKGARMPEDRHIPKLHRLQMMLGQYPILGDVMRGAHARGDVPLRRAEQAALRK